MSHIAWQSLQFRGLLRLSGAELGKNRQSTLHAKQRHSGVRQLNVERTKFHVPSRFKTHRH